ncbi:hypothetical protein AC1031_002186 [Aphanomyces cochlioides]|nr:hypothetical protein AC1031_002186 [Aphanomyces cochlioides]
MDAGRDLSWSEGLEDIGFVIAVDDALHEELTNVCGLLDDDDYAVDVNDANCKKRSRINYQKEELLRLRRQVEELKHELKVVSESKRQCKSIWAVAARHERREIQRAKEEQEQLQTAVNERAAFIAYMKRMLAKKARYAASPPCLQELKLVAQASLRTAAIHAIAGRQRRRQVHTFIQAGVLAQEEDLFRATLIVLPDNRQGVRVINHLNLPVPYRVAAQACWRATCGDLRPSAPPNASETLERIDERTIYERFRQPCRGGVTAISNTIRKYFEDDDVDMLVWRSVLEDALEPHMFKGVVDDMAGWMVCRPHPDDETKCRLTSLFQMPLEAHGVHDPRPATSYPMDAILSLLKPMSFVSTRGFIADESKVGFMDVIQKIPIPSMGTFLERGRLFEVAIKTALNAAITSFQTKSNLECNEVCP